MTDEELEIFNTHNWGVQKTHNNAQGEPVYITICNDCGSLVSEVRHTQRKCRRDLVLWKRRKTSRTI